MRVECIIYSHYDSETYSHFLCFEIKWSGRRIHFLPLRSRVCTETLVFVYFLLVCVSLAFLILALRSLPSFSTNFRSVVIRSRFEEIFRFFSFSIWSSISRTSRIIVPVSRTNAIKSLQSA